MPDEAPLATATVESVETNGDLADGVAPTAADGGGDDEEDGEEETSVYPIATRQDPISPAEAVAGVPDDWKGAAAWLTAVGVLPELDSGRDDPTCLDLILFIKDGTALCQAVNALAPGTIQTFSESPEKNFQQLANVAAFLEGCAALGIPEVDLCTADDIHSAAAVGAVLDTLALLSQTAAAKDKGFSQFSTAECTNDTVYSNLEEMVQQMADSLGEDANIELYAQVAKCADRDDSGGLYGLTAAGGERRLSDSWGPSGVVYTTVYDEARRKPVLTDDASGDHLFSKVEQMMSQQQKAEGANGEDAFESADFDDVYTACLYQPPEEGDAILYVGRFSRFTSPPLPVSIDLERALARWRGVVEHALTPHRAWVTCAVMIWVWTHLITEVTRWPSCWTRNETTLKFSSELQSTTTAESRRRQSCARTRSALFSSPTYSSSPRCTLASLN